MDLKCELYAKSKENGIVFSMGFVGSFPYHHLMGLIYASPPGSYLSGGYRAAGLNAARFGGKCVALNLIVDATMFFMKSAGVKENDLTYGVVSTMVATGLMAAPRYGLSNSAHISTLSGGIMGLVILLAEKFDHKKK